MLSRICYFKIEVTYLRGGEKRNVGIAGVGSLMDVVV